MSAFKQVAISYEELTFPTLALAAWLSGSTLVSINDVTLCRALLVSGWVTGLGFNSRCQKPISVYNQPRRSTKPGHPSTNMHYI